MLPPSWGKIFTAPILFAVLALVLLASSTTASSPWLCRCTCFTTNTTIIPLYKPVDPSNPCTTCTRQFCIDQNLKECQGARIENPDVDVGTGWEGDVWARCFQRDSAKDHTLVTLYILTVVVLLIGAATRSHLEKWYEVSRASVLDRQKSLLGA